MKSVSRLLVLSVLLLCAAHLTGCQSDDNEQFIQGQPWEYRAEKATATGYDFVRWTFTDDKGYVYEIGPLDHPRLQSGHYQIVESQENKIVLDLAIEMRSLGMERYDNTQIIILIDREAQTLNIGGREFRRVAP